MTYVLAFLGIARAAENLLVLVALLILIGIGFWAVAMSIGMGIHFACGAISNISRRIRLRYRQPQK
ncbi:MAG: hypothetical protein QG606_144 [Patescibacteria group bacterium]|nr:hypothetical protein [Patescibacteria group bacterium]